MIIIPARLASTRFPKKILADINGVPMVIATAKQAAKVDAVAVAVDDEEVAALVELHGFKAVMTSKEHLSGTDRINEVATKLGLSDSEFVINLQADEPFIEQEILEAVEKRLKSLPSGFKMASCYKSISKAEAADSNMVKVVTDKDGYAVYFSRSVIPYDRDGGFDGYKGHIGIYGFDAASLRTFCELKPAEIELVEKLEQLRALDAGCKIAMVSVQTKSFGIDTPEDLKRALRAHE